MKLVFDTSALSLFFSNNDKMARTLSEKAYDQALIPLAVDAEIRFGFEYGNRTTENLKKYRLFIQQHSLEVVAPDQDTSIIYADLASWLRQNGIALSNNDIWIAATCVQFGASLVSLDKDFTNLPQILRLNLTIT